MFVPPSARRNFFKCAPPPPLALKSWIRPCCTLYETPKKNAYTLYTITKKCNSKDLTKHGKNVNG